MFVMILACTGIEKFIQGAALASPQELTHPLGRKHDTADRRQLKTLS
jgi:hypothetical protein